MIKRSIEELQWFKGAKSPHFYILTHKTGSETFIFGQDYFFLDSCLKSLIIENYHHISKFLL